MLKKNTAKLSHPISMSAFLKDHWEEIKKNENPFHM